MKILYRYAEYNGKYLVLYVGDGNNITTINLADVMCETSDKINADVITLALNAFGLSSNEYTKRWEHMRNRD